MTKQNLSITIPDNANDVQHPPPPYSTGEDSIPTDLAPEKQSNECIEGHDTRLSKPCILAVAATLPFSALYILNKKTRKCRRCGEKVAHDSCCTFS